MAVIGGSPGTEYIPRGRALQRFGVMELEGLKTGLGGRDCLCGYLSPRREKPLRCAFAYGNAPE
jgi:hypothetical protein